MPFPTAVINVVGLSESLLGDRAPRLTALARRGESRRLRPDLPAVTCSVQSSMLTGRPPGGAGGHGIVGNGWYDRDLGEVLFWKQANRLVHGEKVWETARRRDPSVTTANMFWWFSMHSSADFCVTPRPQYRADGRKIPDCWSHPADLRDLLQSQLGRFPLFQFWGPGSSIVSSRWIAEASKLVHRRHAPTLMLIYLPHLDYGLQKFGPDDPRIGDEVAAIDAVVGDLLDFFDAHGVRVIVLSEYGIEPVTSSVPVNRALRELGRLAVRDESGHEMLDPGASQAFAVADHQVAHLYVKDASEIETTASLCAALDGVDQVLDRGAQRSLSIDHPRGGDLLLVANAGRWFSYDYWLDPRHAPDFARTVDIHRKPGYDPCELFIDPRIRWPRLAIGWRLLRRRLGFRGLMDVIPLDTSLVRGSHGRTAAAASLQPLMMSARPLPPRDEIPCMAVRDVILDHLFDDGA